MAVYTFVDETELRAFLTGYELGELLDHRGIAEGVENSNWRLDTTRGRFILTVYEQRVDAADLPFFLGLKRHLAQRGVPCPQPVENRRGEVLGRLVGKPATIVTFMVGDWPRSPGLDHCRQVGALLARLHQAGEGFALRRANALAPVGWHRLVDRCAPRADEVAPSLGEEITVELSALEASWPCDLPTGVIHADLFPDNVLFDDGRLSGIIDFYFACDDILAYDLAICINAWGFVVPTALDPARTDALVTGYESVRSLAPAERAALPLLARGAAFRFLLTRLHDWLHRVDGALVEPKDPLEYLAKLRFFRSAAGTAGHGLA